MFDVSWSELLLIGVVALVVIGPKELPGVLRTLGQWMRKVRSMAADFQNQFQEAMREAEMADLKQQVDDMAHDFKNFDPLGDVKKDVESMGRDVENSLQETAAVPDAGIDPAATFAPAEVPPDASEPPEAAPAHEAQYPVGEAAAELHVSDIAATAPVTAEAATETVKPESRERPA